MNDGQEIAYCGLVCSTCPIHVATIEKDELKRLELRRNIVSEIREKYHREVVIEQITGGECRSDHIRSAFIFSNADRTIVGTQAALHAMHGFGHDLSPRQGLVTLEVLKWHEEYSTTRSR